MRINNNMLAANTNRQLGITGNNQSKSMEKLSSGLKINRAGDDAAGLSISEKMRGQIRGLDMASKNAQDSISLIQTAEGALGETHAILQRMRELSVQSSNDTNVSADRESIQGEYDQLAEEITRIAEQTEFNTQTLMTGKFTVGGSQSGGLSFHIGANSGQNVKLKIGNMSATGLGVDKANADLETQTGSDIAIKTVNTAIENVSKERSKLGAMQNRLEHTIKNVENSSENLQGAESRIRDVDMAKEMVNMSKNNILQQAAQSMLSQANQAPQGVLQLLR